MVWRAVKVKPFGVERLPKNEVQKAGLAVV
jgi:hypothetical protein